ncbi:TMEM175 family protein [Agromyces laixinhei]|uniref:TMEM175 family protein n=1 Tax=Agromyces laixinhei TaxID=2585717 RepID=UPI00111695DA|nr:TMEM175 family protein [Agromyces laixinhei]
MIRRRQHPDATQATTRLEAFTDGVFAIAATLLVLDLTTHALGEVDSDAQLWAALGGMWELFLNFGVSFIVLCLLWMTHVQQFESIARVDAVMTWLNNGRLLFVVLVPFTTGVATEYSEYYAGRMLMPITFFLAILFSWLQWRWAVHHRSDLMPDLPEQDVRTLDRGSLSAVILATSVVVLSPWLGSAAFLMFTLDSLLTRALRTRSAGAGTTTG